MTIKNRDYKARAREALLGKYTLLVAAQILAALIAGAAALLALFFLIGGFAVSGNSHAIGALCACVILFVLCALAAVIVNYFLLIGQMKLWLNICRGGAYGFSDMFYGFRKGSHPFRYIGVWLVGGLLILIPYLINVIGLVLLQIWGVSEVMVLLWGFLWLLINIYVILSLSFAPVIVIDKPGTGVLSALSQSRKLMRGRKLRLLWLEISFLFWTIPAALTLGVANIWITPYVRFSQIMFYLNARGELPKEDGSPAENAEAPQPAAPKPQAGVAETGEVRQAVSGAAAPDSQTYERQTAPFLPQTQDFREEMPESGAQQAAAAAESVPQATAAPETVPAAAEAPVPVSRADFTEVSETKTAETEPFAETAIAAAAPEAREAASAETDAAAAETENDSQRQDAERE